MYDHRISELTRLEKTFGIIESKMNVLLVGLGFLAALGEASTPEQIIDGKVCVNNKIGRPIPVTTFTFGAVNGWAVGNQEHFVIPFCQAQLGKGW